MTIEIEEPASFTWLRLPLGARKLLTERALESLLEGKPYPSGADKIELAIDLAEAGVDADTISTLSHLDKSMFEDFMPK